MAQVIRLPSPSPQYDTKWANQYTKAIEIDSTNQWNLLQELEDALAGGDLELTVGNTTIGSGTNGRVLYDNNGVLGEKAVTGTGDVVLATSPTLVTPALGTPASGNLTNCTGFPGASSVTAFLGADVALNNTANYFDGPNTGSIGANGQMWFLTATGTYTDTSAAATIVLAIYNGTSYICSSVSSVAATNFMASHTVSAVVTLSAATTFTLRARDVSTTNGSLLTSGSASAVANKATSITAVRLS